MFDFNLGDDLYGKIIRGSGVLLAIGLWVISMRFSVSGFQIASQEDAWVGWVLGLTVTYLQILFNRGAKNQTIYYAGILAYVYGLTTNLVGIMALRGNSFTVQWLREDWVSFVLQLTIVIAIAAAVEILPEHMFINSLRDSDEDGDFVGSLRRGAPSINSLFGTRQKSNGGNGKKRSRGKQQKQGGKPRRNNNKQRQSQPTEQRRPRISIESIDEEIL